MIEAWVEVAVFGAAMPIGAAFVWLLLLRAFAGAVVWLMLGLLVVSCTLMSVRVRVRVRVRVTRKPNPNPNPNQVSCTLMSVAMCLKVRGWSLRLPSVLVLPVLPVLGVGLDDSLLVLFWD